jgi:hypothetical protein
MAGSGLRVSRAEPFSLAKYCRLQNFISLRDKDLCKFGKNIGASSNSGSLPSQYVPQFHAKIGKKQHPA